MKNSDQVEPCRGCGGVLQHAPRCLETGCPGCGVDVDVDVDHAEGCPVVWYATFDEHREGKLPEDEELTRR